MHLRSQLFSITKGNSSITEYFQRVKTLADTLAAIGQPLPAYEIALSLLNGLDSSYDPLVASISTHVDPLTLEDIYSHLLSFEQRLERHTANVESTMGSANMATRNDHSCGRNNGRNSNQQHSPQPASSRDRSRGRGRGSSFSSDSRPTCQLCGKTGHIAPKCFHRFDLSYQGSSPNMSAYFTAPQNAADMNWYPDTGSTNHLTNDLQNLNLHVEPYNGHDNILVDDGTGLRIFNIGSSTIPYRTSSFHLRNLLHPLAIKNNLISVSQFTLDNDVFIEFHAGYFVVKDEATGTILLHGKTRDGLYPFPSTKQLSKSLQSFLCHHVPLEVWHYRLGHPSYRTVQQILSKHNLSVSTNKAPASCIACQQGKSHRLPFSSSESKSTFPFRINFFRCMGTISCSLN